MPDSSLAALAMTDELITIDMFLSGRLTRPSLALAIEELRPEMSRASQVHLVVDALSMDSYTAEAREDFVAFAREMRGKIARVSILTDRALWRVVIAAMSLASGMPMRAYATRGELGRTG